jgi:hypothetical protein
MEAVVHDAVRTHLTANSLIRSSQHGSVKGKSCVTNLQEFLEQQQLWWTGEINNVAYLDFAKAFDDKPVPVPHMWLLKKMEAPSMKGDVKR